jgi:hypothetical protein
MGRKKGNQDRPLQDMSGQQFEDDGVGADYLAGQAEEDRRDAKTKHLDTGLTQAKQIAGDMVKLAAAGMATDQGDLKAALLNELADKAAELTTGSRKAVRDAKAETRNVQD